MVYIVDKVNRNLATKPANARKHRNQLTNLDQALKLRIVEDNYNVPLLVKTAQFINFMYLRRLASSLDQGTVSSVFEKLMTTKLSDAHFDQTFTEHNPTFDDLVSLNYPLRTNDFALGNKLTKALIDRIQDDMEHKRPGLVIKMLLNISFRFVNVRLGCDIVEATSNHLTGPDVLRMYDLN